jgi:hypothetical protein
LSGRPVPETCPLSQTRAGRSGFLFGLAPDGVFRAASLARRAVRSYRTFSPLLAFLAKRGRFNFLWHFPSKNFSTFRPRISSIKIKVTRHRAQWCSDFPLLTRAKSDSPLFQNQIEHKEKKWIYKSRNLNILAKRMK